MTKATFYSTKNNRQLVNMILTNGKYVVLWFDIESGAYYKNYDSEEPVLTLDQRIAELGELVKLAIAK